MIKLPDAKDYRRDAMLEKSFIEEFPLYKWFNLERTSRIDSLQYSPSINKPCPNCASEQTFTYKSHDQSDWMSKPRVQGQTIKDIYKDQSLTINYECKGCHTFQMIFNLKFSEDGSRIQKIGQFPAIAIQPSKEISSFLGEYVDLFKKGLICESHSYGIAAFSYYRRIVELEIERLLNEVKTQVDTENIESFDAVFKEIKDSHYAKDKIDLISKIIPSHLKPGGANPMGILYKSLSEGLHKLSDEECLENATAVRQTLESFIHLLNANKEAIARLSRATTQLLGSKKE